MEISLGLIGLLILGIVMVSGCTSNGNNSTKNYANDIFLQQTTNPISMGNGWQQVGCIASKDGKSYANVTLIATGYIVDNQVIGSDKVFFPSLSNQYQSTGFEAKFKNNNSMKLDHFTIQVLNATPV